MLDAAAYVVDGGRLSATERLAIYRRMFVARTQDVLESQFPRLFALLGRERFVTTIRDYLATFPPRSWTLDDLGARLARYLAQRTAPSSSEAACAYTHHVLADVARLDWAFGRVRRSRVEPPLDAAALRSSSLETIASLRFQRRTGTRLVALRHDADRLERARPEELATMSTPGRPRTHAVWIQGDRVRTRALSTYATRLARTLQRGTPLVEALVTSAPQDSPLAPERIQRSLRAIACLLSPRD
ncbi:MAG: putative DNA-binding domain-containing protein [Planctomycetes bacterium]|nr:putative DNA-binding domain-containing protein [Planctomycetota bacterium]